MLSEQHRTSNTPRSVKDTPLLEYYTQTHAHANNTKNGPIDDIGNDIVVNYIIGDRQG